MQVTPEHLIGIVDNMWTSIFGASIAPLIEEKAMAPEALTACVHITGTWSGALLIVCSTNVSRKVAAAMFAMEPTEIGDSESRDALGELSNIAGGNLKSILPPGCQLSLPTVVEGTAYTVDIRDSHSLCQQAFDCEGEPFLLRVLEKNQRKKS